MSFLSTFHFAKLHFTIGFLCDRIAFNFLGTVLGSEPSHLLLISEGAPPNAWLICSVIQTVISQATASPVGVPSGRELYPIFSPMMLMEHSFFQRDIYFFKIKICIYTSKISYYKKKHWIKSGTKILTLFIDMGILFLKCLFISQNKLMIKDTSDTFSIRFSLSLFFLVQITELLIHSLAELIIKKSDRGKLQIKWRVNL